MLKLIPASHDFGHLLSHPLIFLSSLYGEQYRSDSVRVYGVYFHDKISSEVHLNICSRLISRHHFQDKILACLGLSILSCSESN